MIAFINMQVVQRVLNASPVDMIINPIDSRRFLEQGDQLY